MLVDDDRRRRWNVTTRDYSTSYTIPLWKVVFVILLRLVANVGDRSTLRPHCRQPRRRVLYFMWSKALNKQTSRLIRNDSESGVLLRNSQPTELTEIALYFFPNVSAPRSSHRPEKLFGSEQ